MLEVRDEAYKDLMQREETETQRDYVHRCIVKHKKITRQTIVELTGVDINAVCGRVKELIDDGFIIEEQAVGTRGLLRPKTDDDKPIKKECLTDTEFSKLFWKIKIALDKANDFQKDKLRWLLKC